MPNNNAKTWESLKKTGSLKPNIKSIGDYNQQWLDNFSSVSDYLEDVSCHKDYLESEDILKIHELSFRDITNFGGELTKNPVQF